MKIKNESSLFSNLNLTHLFLFLSIDIDYIRQIFPPNTEEEFFNYLFNLTTKDVKVYAIREGNIFFKLVTLT